MTKFLKIADAKPGMIVCCTGFDCMDETPREIMSDNGDLLVRCSLGHHYLDGQIDGDEYVGIYQPENNQ